jgi:hypothetical protein
MRVVRVTSRGLEFADVVAHPTVEVDLGLVIARA